MTNCIIYARTGMHNPVALNEQLYACTKIAKKKQMEIVGVFTDEGDSGEGLAKAIGMIATQTIDYFIIERTDRISRKLHLCFCITDMMRAADCEIIKASE